MNAFELLIGGWEGEGEPPGRASDADPAGVRWSVSASPWSSRSSGEPVEMPDSISIIGGAPEGEPQPMHYFDVEASSEST